MAEDRTAGAAPDEPAATEIQYLRYVPHSDLISRLAEGWVISDELHGVPHGHHATLMVWAGEGDPR